MDKARQITQFLIVLFLASYLTGCSFSSSSKKTEISLNNASDETNQNVNIENGEAIQDVKNNENAQNIPDIKNVQKEDDSDNKSDEAPAAPITPEKPAMPETEEKAPAFKINDRLVKWGFQKSSDRKIDTIIIHSSYNAVGDDPYDLDDIIEREYKPAGVSPHYIISHEGKIYRLVEDENIAYHAGASEVPDGRQNVNNFSIGIEVVGTKSEGPSDAQYSSLKKLLSYLKDEHDIKYVLGHSDIAPGRKDDPWSFSWSKIGGKKK